MAPKKPLDGCSSVPRCDRETDSTSEASSTAPRCSDAQRSRTSGHTGDANSGPHRDDARQASEYGGEANGRLSFGEESRNPEPAETAVACASLAPLRGPRRHQHQVPERLISTRAQRVSTPGLSWPHREGRGLLLFVWLLSITGAFLATSSTLASNNLLPKAVSLHAAGCLSLVLLSTKRRWGLPGWLGIALAGWVVMLALVIRGDTVGPTLDAVSALAVVLAVAAGVGPRSLLIRLFTGLAVGNALIAFLDGVVPLGLGEGTRPSGLLASRATAGAFTASVAALVVPSSFHWASASSLVTLGAMVVATRARAAWAALMLAFLASSIRERSLRALLLCGAGGALVLMAPFPGWRWTSSTPWQDSLASLARLDVGDRMQLWRDSVRLVSFVGSGVGGFEARFPTPPDATTRVEAPHFEALRSAIELGVGSILLVSLIAMALRPRRGRRARHVRWALVVLLMCSFTGKTFSEPPTLVLAAVLTGLLLRPSMRLTRTPATHSALALVAAAGFAFACVAVDARHLQSSAGQQDAERLRAAGQLRTAWERLEPGLDNARDMAPWRVAFELLRDIGDTRRCEALRA